jgi:hypothetical protein
MNAERAPRAPAAATELAILCLAGWALLAAVPLALGGVGLGWDALNHHFYLGWLAVDGVRFDRDFLAASYQSLQFPYLYWPLYQLARHDVPGPLAGAVLASLNVVVLPALWLLARSVVAERSWYGSGMRTLAIALAFMSGVVLSHLDTTANDLYAAIPMVWALAVAVLAFDPGRPGWATPLRLALLSGALAGLAAACKLSNGPLVLVLPVLWALAAGGIRRAAWAILAGGTAVLASFVVFYGYWGWQLWVQHGNPIYYFHDSLFAPLRSWLRWGPP